VVNGFRFQNVKLLAACVGTAAVAGFGVVGAVADGPVVTLAASHMNIGGTTTSAIPSNAPLTPMATPQVKAQLPKGYR
jgi:hypothetical protein